MYCRSSGKIVVYRAKSKRKSDLIPLLLNHTQAGTTVHSDQASMYVNSRNNTSLLELYGFNHFWVNHSFHYVDPADNTNHTNNIERVWRSLKRSISHIKRSVPEDILDSYIDTFVLKYNVGEEIFADVIFSIMRTFIELYPSNVVKF